MTTTEEHIAALMADPAYMTALGIAIKAYVAEHDLEARKAADIATSDAFLAGAQWAMAQGHTHGPSLSSVLRDQSGAITGVLRENVEV